MFHSPACVSGLYDFTVMCEAIKHGGGHFLIAKDLRPFTEGQIGGDDHRGLLIEFGDKMEEQLTAGFGERQIPQLIEHHQIEANQFSGYFAALTGQFFLLQFISQIHQVVKPSPHLVAHRLGGNCNGQVRFTGSGTTDKNQVDVIFNEGCFVQ